MAQRFLGIEITRHSLRLAQVARGYRFLRLERARVQPVPSGDGPSAPAVVEVLCAALSEGGFAVGAVVCAGAPQELVLFRQIETDLARPDLLRQVLSFEIEDDMPAPASELVAEIAGFGPAEGGRNTALIAAVRREALADLAQTLAQAGPRVVLDTPLGGLHWLACRRIPGFLERPVVLLAAADDRVWMGLGAGSRLVSGRSVSLETLNAPPGLAREVELSWRDAFGWPRPDSTLTVLVGDDEAVARFTRELGPDWSGDKAALDPFTGLDCAEGTARDPRLAAALGLALRVASGEGPGVNFLEVESRPARQAAEMRRGVALLVALVVAAAGVWTAGVFARLHRLETRYARAREEIRRVFREALPDEPAIVREVEQMAQRLEATRKEHRAFTAAAGAGSSPLHALRALEAAMPKGHGANVAQISIVEGRVTLRGEAGSYESVERLQKTLQAAGAFASVEFGDVEVLPKGGAVRFVLLIRLAAR